jgi:hypothetical protein
MRTLEQQAKQARAAGRKSFLADRPCRYGHYERNLRGACVACTRHLRSALRPSNQSRVAAAIDIAERSA